MSQHEKTSITGSSVTNKPASSKDSKVGSERAKSHQSQASRVSSVSLAARKAALLAEAGAIAEKESIDRQMFELRQRAKRLELKTEIEKLQAQQAVLEGEESGSAISEVKSQIAQERVAEWVKNCERSHAEDNEETHLQQTQLNSQAQEFRPSNNPVRQGARSEPVAAPPAGLEDVIQALHIPKAVMSNFDGDPIKYWTFIRSFHNAVGRYNISEDAKLARLLQYCQGKAKRVIESCAAMPAGGYTRALELLQQRFGDNYTIATSWVTRVITGPRVTNETLQDYADELLNMSETLLAMGALSEVNHRALVEMVERLPVYLQHRWRRQAVKLRETGRVTGIKELVDFVCSAAREVNDPVYGNLGKAKQAETRGRNTGNNAKRGFHGVTSASPQSQTQSHCTACKSSSCPSLFKCESFKAMTPQQRFNLAKANQLCFNCLKGGHSSSECKVESTCTAQGCRRKHTKFFHVVHSKNDLQGKVTDETKKEPAEQSASVSVCGRAAANTPKVALPVVQVKVTAANGHSANTFALLDNGSTSTFCTTSLLRQLESEGRATNLNLTTLESDGSKLKTAVHDLMVSDSQGQNRLATHSYEVSSIPVSSNCTAKLDDLNVWDHLKDLDIPTVREGQVNMLIGQDHPEILMPLETRACQEPGAPYATRTLFGWTINGPLGEGSGESRVNFISLEEQVENFWKVEGASAISSKGPSQEDRAAALIMQQSIKLVDGHYSVAIPFRTGSHLPYNRPLAEKRLESLKRKLQQNPALKEPYNNGMRTLIHKGHAERVLEIVTPFREWYIPHHPVFNENKGKIRIVFDCAARYNETALNDKVLQGPDLTNGLLGILLRFRERSVAMSADIEAMFYQVRVPDEDRDALRFLWWPDGNVDKPPETYRMTVHLFGGTWSPSVCSYALKQTAKDATNFDPDVLESVEKDFYVDDFLKSVDTPAEARRITREMPRLLHEGGFRLCKWLTNKREVLEAIPETERAKGLQDLNQEALPVERTLGVLWDVEADAFTFAVRDPRTRKASTKIGVLGAVSSVYDPIGFLSPFTVRGRMLVQDLARDGVGWDEQLSEEHVKTWNTWCSEVPSVSNVKISRCLLPEAFGNITRCELHHFSDASTLAYGAVSYARFQNQDGRIHCSLVFSRSRVAPLKTMTIPRLELAAATLAVHQDRMIRQEHTLKIDDSVFWTDSAIVLAYINNKNKRFHTFVANRLATIHAGSSPRQWKHIKSDLNPADDLSRGVSIHELNSSVTQGWFQGPEFLRQELELKRSESPEVSLEKDPEVKHSATSRSTNTEPDIINDLIANSSSWKKLRRTMAWVMRYRAILLAKVKEQKSPYSSKWLTVQELTAAERAIILFVQSNEYSQEIRDLKTPTARVKKSSKIYKLDPMLSDDNLLVCRVRSRTLQAGGTTQGQPILPKKHHVSTLLARHYHEMSGHSGREYTTAELRQRYCIQGIRSIVRKCISNCVTCRRLFAKPENQRMGDFPSERIAVDEPPFSHVGVDCFGPFQTKAGRKINKRYGCLFTCLTSRAVHLEVLDTMDTSSFINSLIRFTSRRGHPNTIRCDNGTNFVGADRELRASINEWDQQAIDRFTTNRSIQWKFNPPGASHMGGAWERLIRTVRRVLSAVMTQQDVSDDALYTMMCLVESIVNNRPLTTVSDDPAELEPLTPNHLLQLRPTRQPPPGIFVKEDCYVRRRWRQIQYLADVFWRRWLREYLPLIQLRTKWREQKRNLSVGDIVLIVDYAAPRNQWQMARVISVAKGADELVRAAQVRTQKSILTRPITKLCFLEGRD